ncbi:MAG: hypothetical protein Kow0069_20220 [Promethearchaeota archaeon]
MHGRPAKVDEPGTSTADAFEAKLGVTKRAILSVVQEKWEGTRKALAAVERELEEVASRVESRAKKAVEGAVREAVEEAVDRRVCALEQAAEERLEELRVKLAVLEERAGDFEPLAFADEVRKTYSRHVERLKRKNAKLKKKLAKREEKIQKLRAMLEARGEGAALATGGTGAKVQPKGKRFCSSCGARRSSSSANFCVRCGTRL